MKEGWTYKKLGDICRIGIGRTPSRSDSSLWDKDKSTHNYWVSIADMGAAMDGIINDTKEHISDKAASSIQIIPKGTLLLSFKLTLGKTAIAGKDLYTNEAIANLPFVSQEVDREFLSYYFQYFNWGKFSAGDEKVMGKTLNKKKLDILPVMYPSFSEQKRIVSRLDDAFAHIDEIMANAKEQISEARKLFQRCLAKAMEPKEGWEEMILGDIAQVRIGPFGSLLHKKDYISGGIALVNPVHMCEGQITIDDNFTVSEDKANELSNYLLKTNDIVFARRGEIGRCAIVSNKENGCLCGTGSMIVRFNKIINPIFMLNLFQSSCCRDYLESNASGATMLNINSGIVAKMPLIIPSLSEQQQIVARLDALSAHVKELEEINQEIISECDALKKSMLRKVFE